MKCLREGGSGVFYQLWLKRAGAIARCCQIKTARGGFDSFAARTVPTICRLLSLQMRCHFRLKRSLPQLPSSRRFFHNHLPDSGSAASGCYTLPVRPCPVYTTKTPITAADISNDKRLDIIKIVLNDDINAFHRPA